MSSTSSPSPAVLEACARYHFIRQTLAARDESWRAGNHKRVLRLNAYQDAIEATPKGLKLADWQPELAQQGEALLEQCSDHAADQESLRGSMREAHKEARTIIGTEFGAQMGAYSAKEFDRLWTAANKCRFEHLDGKPVDHATFGGSPPLDAEGAMFTAFGKAAGYTNPVRLAEIYYGHALLPQVTGTGPASDARHRLEVRARMFGAPSVEQLWHLEGDLTAMDNRRLEMETTHIMRQATGDTSLWWKIEACGSACNLRKDDRDIYSRACEASQFSYAGHTPEALPADKKPATTKMSIAP